jgi:xanthine dehydrogenase YagT iron-sulfur-binding subunit
MSGPRDGDKNRAGDLSRRGFIGSLGAGAAGAVALGGEAKAGGAEVVAAGETIEVSLKVNDVPRTVRVEPRTTLLQVLRGPLGLKGSKPGCERGECGACTVLFDGVPRYACQTLAVEAEGAEITTVEGLLDGEELGPVQHAFVEEDAFQCGFCTSGQVVAVEGMLRKHAQPDEAAIREGLSGNLCRCAAYDHIVKAAARAAQLRKGGA